VHRENADGLLLTFSVSICHQCIDNVSSTLLFQSAILDYSKIDRESTSGPAPPCSCMMRPGWLGPFGALSS